MGAAIIFGQQIGLLEKRFGKMRTVVKTAFLCDCGDGKIGIREHFLGIVYPHRLHIFRGGTIAQSVELTQQRGAGHIGKPTEIF